MKREWWRGSVTYQIYPRSFQDDNGDGIGDLPGITRRLPYLADLGVDAVWLSPVFPSPMKDMGYDVSDYRDIDPVFGTLADFDRLVERAHALGLKIIIDQVISHSSDRHPAFVESRASRSGPKADWYVWADPRPDGTPPNNWLAIFGGGAWTWDARRHQYYLHNFLPEQPDFNFHNPEVQEFHLGNMAFWLDRGVDGFRLDTRMRKAAVGRSSMRFMGIPRVWGAGTSCSMATLCLAQWSPASALRRGAPVPRRNAAQGDRPAVRLVHAPRILGVFLVQIRPCAALCDA